MATELSLSELTAVIKNENQKNTQEIQDLEKIVQRGDKGIVDSLNKIYSVLMQQLNFDKEKDNRERLEAHLKPREFQQDLVAETATKEKDSKESDGGLGILGGLGVLKLFSDGLKGLINILKSVGGALMEFTGLKKLFEIFKVGLGSIAPKIMELLGVVGPLALRFASIGAVIAGLLTVLEKFGSWFRNMLGLPSIQNDAFNMKNYTGENFQSNRPMTQEEFEQNRISKTVGGEAARNVEKSAAEQPMTVEKMMESRKPVGGEGLGQTVAKYESGKRGTGAIGYDEAGGTSYGKYQIASKPGTFNKFLSHLEKTDPEAAAELRNAGPANTGGKSGSAVETWKKLSGEGRLQKAEHEFIKETHYDPAIKKAEQLGYNVNDPRIQEMVWSGSVQHSGKGINKILSNAAGKGSTEEQIKSFYDARTEYAKENVKQKDLPGVLNRYKSEVKDVLSMDTTKTSSQETASKVSTKSEKSPSNMVDSSELRIKGGIEGQATKGGESQEGTMNLARSLQAKENELPGGLNRFTAFNDDYHHKANPKSTHTKGLATDITLKDSDKSTEAVEYIKNHLIESGLSENDFKIIDEYKNPSKNSTGGHIHVNFANEEAAKSYANYSNGENETKFAKIEKELPEGKGYAEEESEMEETNEPTLSEDSNNDEEYNRIHQLIEKGKEKALSGDMNAAKVYEDTAKRQLEKFKSSSTASKDTGSEEKKEISKEEQTLTQEKSDQLSNLGVTSFGSQNPFGAISQGINQNPFGAIQGALGSIGSVISMGQNMKNMGSMGGAYGVQGALGGIQGVLGSLGMQSPVLGQVGQAMGSIGNVMSSVQTAKNIGSMGGGLLGGINAASAGVGAAGSIFNAGKNILGGIGSIFGEDNKTPQTVSQENKKGFFESVGDNISSFFGGDSNSIASKGIGEDTKTINEKYLNQDISASLMPSPSTDGFSLEGMSKDVATGKEEIMSPSEGNATILNSGEGGSGSGGTGSGGNSASNPSPAGVMGIDIGVRNEEASLLRAQYGSIRIV